MCRFFTWTPPAFLQPKKKQKSLNQIFFFTFSLPSSHKPEAAQQILTLWLFSEWWWWWWWWESSSAHCVKNHIADANIYALRTYTMKIHNYHPIRDSFEPFSFSSHCSNGNINPLSLELAEQIRSQSFCVESADGKKHSHMLIRHLSQSNWIELRQLHQYW